MPTTRKLEPAFLRQLARLTLTSQRRLATLGQGDRRSPLRGNSLQVVDFRPYTPGDDIRQVDWNFYGRSGELFVRLYEDEQILAVHLLIDVSRSMDWGDPNKRDVTLQVAGALAYVALNSYDRVHVGFLGDRVVGQAGPFWGRQQATAAFAALDVAPATDNTDIAASITDYLTRIHRPGLVIVLSDLLSPTSEDGIRRLSAGHHEVSVIHLLAPQEIDPEPAEDIRLIDRETNQIIEVHLDGATLARYQQRLTEWSGGLARLCRQRNTRYVRLSSADDVEHTMIRAMRAQGILS